MVLKEAIMAVCLAEAEAERKIIDAGENSRRMIEAANEAGKAAIARTLMRAETEIAHLTRATDTKATGKAMELVSKVANRQAALRARAGRRMDAAAQLIVERIVKA